MTEYTALALYERHRKAFERYRDLLLKWNEKINLTAITDPEEVKELHFIDSLFVVPEISAILENVSRETLSRGEIPLSPRTPHLGSGSTTTSSARPDGVNPIRPMLACSILDIGAGAGFPGLVLKIARPQIQLTLVDSVKKKCDFMKEVVRQLSLQDVGVVHKRLQEREMIGAFDVVVSRAALELPELLRLTAPNLRSNGILIAMKGEDVSGEVEEAGPVMRELGLGDLRLVRYVLPTSKKERCLVVIPDRRHRHHPDPCPSGLS